MTSDASDLPILGAPTSVEKLLLDQKGASISLNLYDDAPCLASVALVTAGLSSLQDYRLHQELMMCVWRRQLTVEVRRVLEFVTRQLAAGREPLIHGDVIGPAGPLTSSTQMSALYACPPTYFDDEVAAFTDSNGHIVHVLWLVPMHRAEIDLLLKIGVSAFEDLLVTQDPDLLDLGRPPIGGAIKASPG